jgi:DNA-binding NarL/FixJ family response regulator
MSHSHVPSSRWIEGISTIQAPEEVQTMLSLAAKGWGAKRIARELGCSKNTVKRYLRAGRLEAV